MASSGAIATHGPQTASLWVPEGTSAEADRPGSWVTSSAAQSGCWHSIFSTCPTSTTWVGVFSGGVRVLATWGGPLLSRAGGRLFSALEQVGGREHFVHRRKIMD